MQPRDKEKNDELATELFFDIVEAGDNACIAVAGRLISAVVVLSRRLSLVKRYKIAGWLRDAADVLEIAEEHERVL